MIILSGIQPSGRLHLGNYFGMMKPAIELQQRGEAFLFIADYHALTTIQDAEALKTAVRNVALDFLACGLDPEKTAFYRQSDLPEVTELAWLLSVIAPMGLLERCHSYKDKINRGLASSHGLFSYPVLMAADILIVAADVVPVGHDQKQHVEVTRDLAIKFNSIFGDVFRVPRADIREDAAVVPGLDGQKMSKSYGNTIELFGSEKETKKKIMRIVTDSKGVEEAKDPDECRVFALYRLLADDQQRREMAERYRAGGLGYGEVKKELFRAFQEYMHPFRERRRQLENDPGFVDEVLRNGAERARNRAAEIMAAARRSVGLTG